jgi:hypothetical protein
MVDTLSNYMKKNVMPILADRYQVNGGTVEVNTLWLHIIDLVISFDKQMQSFVDPVVF